MSNPISTSTPKQQDETETTALREKKWQNIIEKAEKFDNQRKQRNFPRKAFVSKENRHRGNFKRGQKKFSEQNNALAEKRRKQAIESMQIAEQRRIRKMKEQNNIDKLAEELGMMEISNQNEYLPDGRLKLTKRQLQARKVKQARIRQYYENQQTRRKKSVSFRSPVASTSQAYRVPRKYTGTNKARKPFEKKEDVNNVDEMIPEKPFLRYTKDQLRELCPFGYYFFQ